MKPFKMDHDPRRNLRDWLDNFQYFQGMHCEGAIDQVSRYSTLIYVAVHEVMDFTKTRSGPKIVEYYAEDMPRIERTYVEKDYHKFAEAVRTLRDAINVE